jgi:peptidoglycan hydrolase-like protein with peptidoglycan-binding domain
MRNRALKAVAAVCVFTFLMALALPSFAAKAASSDHVKAIQSALNKNGYHVKVDGKMGPQTETALMKFQKANGLPITGKADAATLKKLGVK